MYLMERCLTGFEDDVDCNTLKYPQVKLTVSEGTTVLFARAADNYSLLS